MKRFEGLGDPSVAHQALRRKKLIVEHGTESIMRELGALTHPAQDRTAHQLLKGVPTGVLIQRCCTVEQRESHSRPMTAATEASSRALTLRRSRRFVIRSRTRSGTESVRLSDTPTPS